MKIGGRETGLGEMSGDVRGGGGLVRYNRKTRQADSRKLARARRGGCQEWEVKGPRLVSEHRSSSLGAGASEFVMTHIA
jgi:hypothetical protein